MKFQFRLRTLMIVVTLLALPLGYVGWHSRAVAARLSFQHTRHRDGQFEFYGIEHGYFPNDGAYSEPPELPWVRRVFGDKAIMFVFVNRKAQEADVELAKGLFPEAHFLDFRAVTQRGE